MKTSYLWDPKAGPPDPFIQRLERALACKRYSPPQRWSPWKKLRVAAVASIAVGAAAAILVMAYAGEGSAAPAANAQPAPGEASFLAKETTAPAAVPAGAHDSEVGAKLDQATVGH